MHAYIHTYTGGSGRAHRAQAHISLNSNTYQSKAYIHTCIHACIHTQAALGECTGLKQISLDSNFIQYIPNTFAQLTLVNFLRLDSNQMVVINPCIGYMTSLTSLWLNLNELTCLPPELSFCTGLTDLKLEGNGLKSPPREILIGGCARILSYLNRLQVCVCVCVYVCMYVCMYVTT